MIARNVLFLLATPFMLVGAVCAVCFAAFMGGFAVTAEWLGKE